MKNLIQISRIFILALMVMVAFGQNVIGATYTAVKSGNWNDPATWGSTTFPVAGDVVNIGNNYSVVVTLDAACSSVTMTGNTTNLTINVEKTLTLTGDLNITGSGSGSATIYVSINVNGTLSVNNLSMSGTGGQSAVEKLTVGSSGQLTVAGNATVYSASGFAYLNIGAGTGYIGGTLALNGGTAGKTAYLQISTGNMTIIGNITVSSAVRAIEFSGSGTLNLGGNLPDGITFTKSTGTVTLNGSSTQAINGSYNFYNLVVTNAASNITLATGTTTGIANIFTPNGTSFSSVTGSTIDFNGTGTQTVPAFNYNNLTISGVRAGNTVTLASGTIGVAGNFSATATFTGSGGYVVTGNTVDLNGPLAQSLSAFTFNNLTTSNTGTKTASGNVVVNGTLNVLSPSVFSPGASPSTNIVSGSGTLNGNGTIQITRTATTPDFLSQYTISNKTLTNLTLDYAGTGNPQTINSSASIGTFGGLKISGGNTKTLAGDITVNGDLTIAAGILSVSAAGNYSITLAGNWVNNVGTGAFLRESGTVTFNNNGAQAITGTNNTIFNNLTVNSNSVVTGNAAEVQVNGTFSLQNNATYIHNNTGAPSSTIFNGTESFAASSTFRIDKWPSGGPSLTNPVSLPFGNLEINVTTVTGIWLQDWATGSLNLCAGNLKITSLGAATLRFTSAAKSPTINVGGSYIQSAGIVDFSTGTSAATVTLNVAGDFTKTGGTLTNSSTAAVAVVNFNGTTQAIQCDQSEKVNFNVLSGSTCTLAGDFVVGTTANGSFTVNNGGTLDCGSTYAIKGPGTSSSFTLSTGGTLKTGNTGGIASSLETTGSVLTTTRTFPTDANYTYNGTAAQFTGSGLPATLTGNLTIANMAGVTPTATTTTVNSPGVLTVNGLLTPTSSQFIAGGTLTGTGTVRVTKTGGTDDFAEQYTISNKTLTGLTVEFAGGAAQKSATTPYGNLQISNTGGVTLGAATTVGGNLAITSGGLTVSSTGSLTVAGTLSNSMGNTGLVLKSDANGTGSLIHSTAGIGAIVERYMTGGWSDWNTGWHQISSPVIGQAISAFASVPATDYDFYGWDEPTNYYINFKDISFSGWNGGTNFYMGRGYYISYAAATTTKTFTGNLNVADVTHSNLTKGGYGFHLLGNPFASAVKWNDGNWALSNVAGGAKIWHESNKSYSDIAANTDYIPSAQGFVVEVSSATNSITIPAASRAHNAAAWYKAPTEVQRFMLVASETEGGSAQESQILINSAATEGFDFDYDSRFLPGYAPLFYSKAGTEQLSTNSLPSITNETVIPFGFVKNGATNFSIDLVESLTGYQLILEDKKLNKFHNFAAKGPYTFTSAASDDPDRFVIRASMVAVSGDYQTRASGNWNGTTTWQRHDGTAWVDVATFPTSADGVITINNGHTVTVTADVTVDQVFIDRGASTFGTIYIPRITGSFSPTFTIADGEGTDVIVKGVLTVGSNSTPLAKIIVNGQVEVNSGGILYANTRGTIDINKTVTVFTGGVLNVGSSGGNAETNLNVNSNGTLNLNGNAILNGGAANIIRVKNGGTLNMAPSTVISGAGTFRLSNGGTLGIGSAAGIAATGTTGNVQNNTGTRTFGGVDDDGTAQSPNTANFIYNGTAAQITGTGLPGAFNNLTINNTAGVSLTNNVVVNGTLTMQSGAISLNGKTLTYGANGVLTYDGLGYSTTSDVEFPAASGPKDLNITLANASGISLHANRSLASAMTIASGQKFIIPLDKQLTVTGTLTNNGGNSGLVILSGGSLINNTGGVPATVERYIPAPADWTIATTGWHLVSSPVSGQLISNGGWITDPVTSYDFYAFDETETSPLYYWINQKIAGNGISSFNTAQGYLVAYENDGTKTFSGALNSAAVSNIPLSFTAASPNAGWNLLGNPYPSGLTWGTWAYGDGSVISGSAKIILSTTGAYEDISVGEVIPALNGFFVSTNAPTTLSIPTTAKVHGGTWYKAGENISKLTLTAYDVDGATAQTSHVRLIPEATTGYDRLYDSEFRPFNAPQFYSVSGERQLSTNAIPSVSGETAIHFGFVKNDGNNFRIEATGVESIGAVPFLTDLKTGTVTNLSQTPVYNFSSAAGDDVNRFLLNFGTLGIEDPQAEVVNIYAFGGILYMNDVAARSEITVTNLLGQVVQRAKADGSGLTTLNVQALPKGVYVVSVTGNGQSISRKVIL